MLVTDVTFILKKDKTIDEAIGSPMPENVSYVLVNYNICQISSAVNAMKETKDISCFTVRGYMANV
jgi:hypothetical protein